MQDYPNCTVLYPYGIGDGFCRGGAYNTLECGFDGGDCEEFNNKYPNCNTDYPWYIGDGYCHGGDYNTAECGFDGGDCEEFYNKYPNCNVPSPGWIGDGGCDGGDYYNTAECGFDGGDCYCNVPYPYLIGDGDCDGGAYNTAECGFDGGDCDIFNVKYPNCTAYYTSLIGDGNCDGGDYNTVECDFDGGDCEDFNVKYPNCNADNPANFENGRCDGGAYNTVECDFDGGDCVDFNYKYPNCNVPYPYLIGDGDCDGGAYNTAECGFDGGDCDCNVAFPYKIGDGNCDGGDYNTLECGFDGGDCTSVTSAKNSFPVWSVVGGVAGGASFLFIAIGIVIWKRKRNTTSTMQETAGGAGVQTDNTKYDMNNKQEERFSDVEATGPSARSLDSIADALDPSAPQISLRNIKPIHMPVQTSSVQPSAATRNIYKSVSQSQGRKSSFPIASPKMYENTFEVSVSQPEPELTFIQKLDLRELNDQKAMGGIHADEYEKRKSKILDGA